MVQAESVDKGLVLEPLTMQIVVRRDLLDVRYSISLLLIY